MAIQYQQFINIFSANPQHLLEFYLPNGNRVPLYAHVTDVGSVFRHFIDCGGQVRSESYVQIQLWTGKDIDHRLNGKTISKILKQAREVLDKLPGLEHTIVVIEYKEALVSQYPVSSMELTDKVIKMHLEALTTQCLASIRYQEKTGDVGCCDSVSGRGCTA